MMKSIIINKNDAGQRLDKFLQKHIKLMPVALLYKHIRKKRVKINGKPGKEADMLCVGDKLDMYVNDEFFEHVNEQTAFLSIKPNISVLYEDENILLVDKKPGVVVHADDDGEQNTLIAHIQAYLYQKGEYDHVAENSFAPALCNRIDRNTGGIVIAAKNAATLRVINEKIKLREIDKHYLCVVHGKMPQKDGTLKAHLAKDSAQNKVMVFDSPRSGSVEIITKYAVVDDAQLAALGCNGFLHNSNLTLVDVQLVTGRTHQIRAHFAHIGNPLLGDTKYGTNAQNSGYSARYQALYSYSVAFLFTSPAQHLGYLCGKKFELDRAAVAGLLLDGAKPR